MAQRSPGCSTRRRPGRRPAWCSCTCLVARRTNGASVAERLQEPGSRRSPSTCVDMDGPAGTVQRCRRWSGTCGRRSTGWPPSLTCGPWVGRRRRVARRQPGGARGRGCERGAGGGADLSVARLPGPAARRRGHAKLGSRRVWLAASTEDPYALADHQGARRRGCHREQRLSGVRGARDGPAVGRSGPCRGRWWTGFDGH